MKGANHTLSLILYHAVKAGNIKYAKTLIEQKADVNFRNQNLSTPLHKAASQGYIEIVKFLIQEHANIDIRNIKGQTALYEAAAYNRPEVLKLLLENNADPNAQMYDDWAALHVSCFWGYDKITKLLLENKASPDILNENCCSPLHFAISHKQTSSALMLVLYGATLLLNDNKDVSPLDLLIGKAPSLITSKWFSSTTKCKLIHTAMQVIDYGKEIENLEQTIYAVLKEILYYYMLPSLIDVIFSYLFVLDNDSYNNDSVYQLIDLYKKSANHKERNIYIDKLQSLEREDEEVEIVLVGRDTE